MKKSEVDEILANSSQDEWIVDDQTGNFTYKKDLNLRIERDSFEDYEEFDEPWAKEHPNSNAQSVNYVVKYNQSFVDRKMLVSVDGHRATLPMPKSRDDLIVREKDVNFAEIVNIGNRLGEYLRRSEIEIVPNAKDDDWF